MMPPAATGQTSEEPSRQGWLDAFHQGARDVLEGCYRDHFQTVTRAVGYVLQGADKETVVHDVFLELLSDAKLRQGFKGGGDSGLAAWLATIARYRAIDYWRRYRCERSAQQALENAARNEPPALHPGDGRTERSLEARLLVEQFRRQVLPAKWAPVFEARFLGELDQRAAARSLGMSRTTLAYQEMQVRRMFKRFVLTRRTK